MTYDLYKFPDSVAAGERINDMSKEEYRSRVYTDRPPYADFDAPAKFQAIESIIAKRLTQHPNAICS